MERAPAHRHNRARALVGELCWFHATVLAAGLFAAALAWIDASTAAEPPPARDALLVLGVGAIVSMIVLIVAGFPIEQRTDDARR